MSDKLRERFQQASEENAALLVELVTNMTADISVVRVHTATIQAKIDTPSLHGSLDVPRSNKKTLDVKNEENISVESALPAVNTSKQSVEEIKPVIFSAKGVASAGLTTVTTHPSVSPASPSQGETINELPPNAPSRPRSNH